MLDIAGPPQARALSVSPVSRHLDRIEVVQECSAWYGGWTGATRPAVGAAVIRRSLSEPQ